MTEEDDAEALVRLVLIKYGGKLDEATTKAVAEKVRRAVPRQPPAPDVGHGDATSLTYPSRFEVRIRLI